MVNRLLERTTRVRRGLAVTGLALTTVLSGVVFAPVAGAATSRQAPVIRAAADQYLISYQGNSGIGTAPAIQRVEAGQSATISENTFVLDEYDFTGWNTRSDGTGTTYRPQASVSPTTDLVLYAQWKYRIEVALFTSAASQVYRTTDPEQLGVFVGGSGYGFAWWGTGATSRVRAGEMPDIDGTIQIRNRGTLIKTLVADPYGFTEMTIPTTLPLGRAEFTATFVPAAADEMPVTSDPVPFTIARATTTTQVTLQQKVLSAADQKKFKVRSGITASVQVGSTGTRTAAPGKVAVTIGSKIVTLTLANGRATSALIPTAAGTRTVTATYQPGNDFWVRSTGRATVTVR